MKYLIVLAILLIPFNLRAADEETTKPELQLMVFSATWCGPCQTMKRNVWPNKELQQIIESNKIKVFNIDVDADQKTANSFKIDAVPTTVIGYAHPDNKIKVISRTVGYQDVPAVKKLLLTAVEQVKPEDEPLDYITIPQVDYKLMVPALDYSF
jgi:thiol-disulfide isomerase/thioredoxin